jgi:nitrile hydratase subunit beta
MDGIHDMGGMHGFGHIDPEDKATFHAAWEGRVFAIAVSTPVPIPGGARNQIENMPPQHYLQSSYYEKWLHARIEGFIEAGIIKRDEIEARIADFAADPAATPPRRDDPQSKAQTLERLRTHRSPLRPAPTEPHFVVGDSVRVKTMYPAGHTRLPRYIRGKCGVIERFYGFQNLQDATTQTNDPPQAVYAVRFDGRQVWGDDAEAQTSLCIDMWESYLLEE